MKARYIVIISLVIIILQTTLFQLLRIGGIIPDFMLVWVVIVSALFDRTISIKNAVISGILVDIISGKGLGVHLAIYLVTSIVIAMIEDKIFKDNEITPLILLTFATMFSYLFNAFVYYFYTGRFILMTRFFSRFLPTLIYNLLVGVVIYKIAIQLQKFERDSR